MRYSTYGEYEQHPTLQICMCGFSPNAHFMSGFIGQHKTTSTRLLRARQAPQRLHWVPTSRMNLSFDDEKTNISTTSYSMKGGRDSHRLATSRIDIS